MGTEKAGLTPAEFAAATGIPLHRVRREIKEGRIQSWRYGERSHALIPRSEVARLTGPSLPFPAYAGPTLEEIRLVVREEIREFFRRASGGD